MGITHLWDTNTVIYYLQQLFPPPAEKFIDNLLTTSHPAISVIREIELLSWRTDNEKDLNLLQNFIQDSFVLDLEQLVKQKAAMLRKTTRIKLLDAIIGATAIAFDLTLVTRNTSDFNSTAEIKLVNPWNL
jgi:predicted nucleic acid-binding protein